MDKKPKNTKKWWLYGALTTFIIAAAGAVLVLFVFNDNKKKHYDDDDDDEDEDDMELVVEEPESEWDDDEMLSLEDSLAVIEDVEEIVLEEDLINPDKFAPYETEEERSEAPVRRTRNAEEDTYGDMDFAEGSEIIEERQVVIEETPVDNGAQVYDVVEQPPTFSQGDPLVWLGQNMHYPPLAEENGVQGTVVCQFIVERDGSISDVRVIRGADPSLDKEAVRVIKSMPNWIPGKQNGQTVRVKYTMPIRFRLQ